MKEKRGANKTWLYVIALVLIIVLLMVFFSSEINFSPKAKTPKGVNSVGLNEIATGESDLGTPGGFIMASRFMGKESVGLNELVKDAPTTDKNIIDGFVKGGNN